MKNEFFDLLLWVLRWSYVETKIHLIEIGEDEGIYEDFLSRGVL